MGAEIPAAIIILLQRSGKPDDILKITPKDADTYFVEFKEHAVTSRVSLTMYSQNLSHYIQNFLLGLYFDLHIPDYVQIEVPGFSSILIQPKSLTAEQRERLVYWISTTVQFLETQAAWPMQHNPGPHMSALMVSPVQVPPALPQQMT